ncbi:MAG: DNA primase [Moraxellaceae bacterium]|nr:DNA primase [Moraxellaceae bacterium]
MSIPNHIFDQLNSQADLASIIGKHTTLKKSGHEYKGCCPFHGEKTPSFYVNPSKNMYHCFGCGVGGNALKFLQDYEGLTFMEAVKELSQQTGIEIPEDENQQNVTYKKQITPPTPPQAPITSPPPVSDDFQGGYFSDDSFSDDGYDDYFLNENPPQDNEGNLYDLLQQIQQFYKNSLYQNPHALQYFQSRGISDKIIDEFALGYAPQGWQHLEQQFPNDIEGLKLLGLVRRSEKGRDYDLLRDRVIFSIRDNQGRIIGFAGRALDDEVKPKYINSSDSPVFHKNHVLYGYYESRQHRAKNWLVVEGYMDVIALYQAGIYGAVASMGTAVNEQQISRLLNLNPVLTLSFDGDSAGQKASWRTLEVSLPILTDDKELHFLTLPNNHDPDTYIKEFGAEAMQEQINNATPLSTYVFNYLSERHDLEKPEGKAKLMSQVRSLTSQLPKGSSFRSLLNNHIYQQLTGRGRYQYTAPQQTFLDFTTKFTTAINLCLCLLYQPSLIKHQPIATLWKNSGVENIEISDTIKKRLQQANLSVPNLPTWQDFHDKLIVDLVATIEILADHLPDDANMASHFILASLPIELQAQLTPHWQTFYSSLLDDNIVDIEPLFQELLIQQLLSCLLEQQKQTTNIFIRDIINKRRLKLAEWQKTTNQEN